MLGYRMDVHTAGQIAAEDPFSGRGVFLPMDAGAAAIAGKVQQFFGEIPSVSWPGRGAWIDTAGVGIGAQQAQSRWETR